MNTQLIWDNVVAYSMQIGLLVGLAATVPTLLRLKTPAVKLAYWQLLLVACLALPAVRPWKQVVRTVRPRPVITQIDENTPLQPMPATPIPKGDIALAILATGAVLRLVWFAGAFWRLRRLRRHSTPLLPAPAWSVEAELGISEAISSPVTFGWLRPVVLLPANFHELESRVQEAILCHEILHVRRRDWLFTLGEELVRSAFWFHPAIWWLLGEIGLAREQAVDREVVEMTKSRDEYVDALLAIAGARPQLDLAPAPLFLRKRHLKQRVVSIMKEVRVSKTKSISALVAGLGMLAAACWLVTATFPLSAAPQSISDFPGVTVDTGGEVLHRTAVMYPQAARESHVEGVVVVEAVLDARGNVTETRVLSGPTELRSAAQQAVLQWHFAMDTGANTRQVRISFQAPPTQPVTIVTGSGSSVTVTAPVPRKGVASADAVRSGVIGGVIAGVPGGVQGGVATREPNIATAVGKRVARIEFMGNISQPARDRVAGRLPVRVGDVLTSTGYDDLNKAVKEIDEHMFVSIGTNPTTGEATIVIGQSPMAGVMGGVIQSVPSTAPIPPAPDGVKRITIGGNVQQAKLISQTRPEYPPLAKQARISGVVHLQAVIAKDGSVADLRVLSGHPLLIPPSLEAVKTWKYQQTLLNGEPVEVVTQIDVNFTLSDEPPQQQQ